MAISTHKIEAFNKTDAAQPYFNIHKTLNDIMDKLNKEKTQKRIALTEEEFLNECASRLRHKVLLKTGQNDNNELLKTLRRSKEDIQRHSEWFLRNFILSSQQKTEAYEYRDKLLRICNLAEELN